MSEDNNRNRVNRRSMLKKTAVAGAVASGFSSAAASTKVEFTADDAKNAINEHATALLSNLRQEGAVGKADASVFTFEKYDDNILLSSNREGFAIINRTLGDQREITDRLVVKKNLGDTYLNVFIDLDSGDAYATIPSDSDDLNTQGSGDASGSKIIHENDVTTSAPSTSDVTTTGKECVDYCSTDSCKRTWANPLDRYNIYYVYDETAGECVMLDGGCC